MITEDYVSFEIAKLLKEKGFDEPCLMCYTSDKKLGNYGHYNSYKNSEVFALTAPTLQMAMKWLREVHNLHCDIGYDDLDWFWNILDVSDSVPVEERPKMIKDGLAGHKTYEKACEAAIKYCLENLI